MLSPRKNRKQTPPPLLTYDELFLDAYGVVELDVKQVERAHDAMNCDWSTLLVTKLMQDLLLNEPSLYILRGKDAPRADVFAHDVHARNSRWLPFLGDAVRMLLTVGLVAFEFPRDVYVPMVLHGRITQDYALVANRVTRELDPSAPFVVVRDCLMMSSHIGATRGPREIDWNAHTFHPTVVYAPDARNGQLHSPAHHVAMRCHHYTTLLVCDEIANTQLCNPTIFTEDVAPAVALNSVNMALSETRKQDRERMLLANVLHAMASVQKQSDRERKENEEAQQRRAATLFSTTPAASPSETSTFEVPTGRKLVQQSKPQAPRNLNEQMVAFREFAAGAFGVPSQIVTGDLNTHVTTSAKHGHYDEHGVLRQYVSTLCIWEQTLSALLTRVWRLLLDDDDVTATFESTRCRELKQQLCGDGFDDTTTTTTTS